MFAANNPPATAATCCPAGISPAAADAAISFSKPSNDVWVAPAVSPCQIQNSVFCATSAATWAIIKSENLGGKVCPKPYPIDWASQSFTKSYLHNCRLTCSSTGSIILSVNVTELFGAKSHPAAVTKAPVDNFLITSL